MVLDKITVDRDTYDRSRFVEPGSGYWLRNHPQAGKFRPDPSTILLHATHGKKGSTFQAECMFLSRRQYQCVGKQLSYITTKNVGADYVAGKEVGLVARTMEPKRFITWHSGVCEPARFMNYDSVGVEMHWTFGEPAFSEMALAQVNRLVLDIAIVYHIEDFRDTLSLHKIVAQPPGRKTDPGIAFDWPRLHALLRAPRVP